jgi:hypothetical protein
MPLEGRKQNVVNAAPRIGIPADFTRIAAVIDELAEGRPRAGALRVAALEIAELVIVKGQGRL